MAGRSRFKSLRRASGSAIGNITVRVYVCRNCGLQHDKKPDSCRKCGGVDIASVDSKAEARRWAELRLLEMAGNIQDLRTQVRFPLMTRGKNGLDGVIGHYVADFVYLRNGEQVIEDVKGSAITDLANWKLKHMAIQYGEVQIIKR